MVLCALFLVGFLVCAGLWIRGELRKEEEKDTYEELKEQVAVLPPAETKAPVETKAPETSQPEEQPEERVIEIPDLELDWTALKERNEDIYSWIYIPNTEISYPVLQHSEETDFYLDHDLDGKEAFAGAIYTQNLNATDYSDKNTVVYGHSMKNGTMFHDLHKYEKADFFESNRYIYIYQPDRTLVYEVYGACEFGNALLPYKYDFETEEGTEEFLEDLRNSEGADNHIMEGLEFPEDEKLLTLSTCIANHFEKRLLIVGVLVYEKEYTEGNEIS
ncbi:MAG: sortase [Lachnospiraceae bacterium]|nr:sortase [Lachnospiraceae bacterium]